MTDRIGAWVKLHGMAPGAGSERNRGHTIIDLGWVSVHLRCATMWSWSVPYSVFPPGATYKSERYP